MQIERYRLAAVYTILILACEPSKVIPNFWAFRTVLAERFQADLLGLDLLLIVFNGCVLDQGVQHLSITADKREYARSTVFCFR